MNSTIKPEAPSGRSLERLVGWRVRIPTKSNPSRHWWATVIEQSGELIKVSGNKNAGRAWWTHAKNITRMGKPANK